MDTRACHSFARLLTGQSLLKFAALSTLKISGPDLVDDSFVITKRYFCTADQGP